MRYRVLGPVTALGENGPLRLGGPKRSTVLAALLLNANRVVPEERLITLVWGNEPPPTARGGLQVHVSELRAVLGKDVVTRHPSGYSITVHTGELDLHIFDEAVHQAGTDYTAGDLEAAAEGLRFALTLYNGPPLAGVAAPLTDSEGPALAERRLTAIEQLFDVELAAGRHTLQISTLRHTADEHPYRERLQGQLMLALHRCGRTAEALRVYTDTHQRLVGELGIEPSHHLQRLHHRILNNIDRDSETPTPPSPSPSTIVRPAELPHDIRGFAGRSDALAALGPADGGIWVISGPPGVGKTALAVHWAHAARDHFPDGQFYLNLRGFEPDDEPLTTTAALTQLLPTLGVDEKTMPQSLDEKARLYRTLLADKHALILLDNARDTQQVTNLLPSSGTVLITSRHRLGDLVAHTGAHTLSLDTLSAADARALLENTLGENTVAEEPDAAAELARLCGYLPLALRIAAANIAAEPEPSIARGLAALERGNPLEELSTDGKEGAVAKAFGVSYAALTPERQRLFRLLGLVPGADFTPQVAAALTNVTLREASRGLKALTAANLVERHTMQRYRFHDLVRLYAADRAWADETAGEREQARERLLLLYLSACDNATDVIGPRVARLPREHQVPDEAANNISGDRVQEWLPPEASNLVALLTQTTAQKPHPFAWYLTDSAGMFLCHQERRLEWLEVAPKLLAAASGHGQRRVEAVVHHHTAKASFLLGYLPEAKEHVREAVRVCLELNWRERAAAIAVDFGTGLDWVEPLPVAVEQAEKALQLFRETGSTMGEALALKVLGWLYRHCGRLRLAHEILLEGLEHGRMNGLRQYWQMMQRVELGSVLHDLGRYREAEQILVECVDAFENMPGSRQMQARTLTRLSAVRCDMRDYERARADAARALDLGRLINVKIVETDAFHALGEAEVHLGRLQQAEKHYRKSLLTTSYVGYWHASELLGLAGVQTALGDHESAMATAVEARSLAAESGHRLIETRATIALAGVRAQREEVIEARELASRALADCRESGYVPGEVRAVELLNKLDVPR